MTTREREDRTELIRERAQQLLSKIEAVLPSKPNEAEFRKVLDRELDDFCAEVSLSPAIHAEYTLATGTADATFNRLVIEYERPGVMSRTFDRATTHAIDQVKRYIKGMAEKEKRKMDRLAGVALDGYYIAFVRYINGKWAMEAPMQVNQHTIERMLTWLSGLTSGIALTAENLNKDFSLQQERTKDILEALYNALKSALSEENTQGTGTGGMVSKLFSQWRLFFSESIDYSEAFGGRKLEPLKKWAAKAGIEIKKAQDAEHFFFALHTYFALLVKFLAWLALSKHLAVKLGAPSFSVLSTLESSALLDRLKKMEDGGIFRAYGIMNLLEGDFFEWYLYSWNDQIEEPIRKLLVRLDQYDPTTLTAIPEETRDLFKKLYHYLLPRVVRHNLGEYYTPDWLAQRLLSQVNKPFFDTEPADADAAYRKELMTTRFLDPACGSGTFLVLIVSRMVHAGKQMMIPENDVLDAILHNVQGVDLNPLAVLTARVNYLLALGDLIEYRKDEIDIPVYLADSVRGPQLGKDLETAGAYEFSTAIGKFHVPVSLCTGGQFERFCTILEESVDAEVATSSFMKRVETELNIKPPNWNIQAATRLRELYEKLVELHSKGMNGLWARLLKNNFAPLAIGKFDYVVGNPPWVIWDHLPDGYRNSIKPIWVRYGLFPHGGMDTILGKGKKDISILMTFVVMDKLLKMGGRLGFVITQSVFKTAGAAQGFRRFAIPMEKGGDIPVRVIYVDDMVSLNPFEGASNRTAVMVLSKGKRTTWPLKSYTLWRKKIGARFSYDSTIEEVTEATTRMNLYAEPVDENDSTSAWLTARPKALKAVRRILGQSDYIAHAGVYSGGVNAVYWVDIVKERPDGLVVVQNINEGAKIKVEGVIEPLEPDLLYPLLRGRDVKRWKAVPSASILMVQDPVKRRGIDEKKMQDNYPKTYAYLKRFEKVLRERPARGVSDMIKNGAPFYTMFAVGDYTFAPWKVVWPNIASKLDAAVIGESEGKLILPQHIVTLVACPTEQEAHYICALINSSCANFAAMTYSQKGGKSFGDPHILKNIRIPKFKPENKTHQKLADLSQKAHKAAKGGNETRGLNPLSKIEAEIDTEAAKIWNLTEPELAEIQRSLKELTDK